VYFLCDFSFKPSDIYNRLKERGYEYLELFASTKKPNTTKANKSDMLSLKIICIYTQDYLQGGL